MERCPCTDGPQLHHSFNSIPCPPLFQGKPPTSRGKFQLTDCQQLSLSSVDPEVGGAQNQLSRIPARSTNCLSRTPAHLLISVRAAQSRLNGPSAPSELPRADRTGFPRRQSCPEQTERTFRVVRAAQSRPNGLSAPSELPKVDRRTFTAIRAIQSRRNGPFAPSVLPRAD